MTHQDEFLKLCSRLDAGLIILISTFFKRLSVSPGTLSLLCSVQQDKLSTSLYKNNVSREYKDSIGVQPAQVETTKPNDSLESPCRNFQPLTF